MQNPTTPGAHRRVRTHRSRPIATAIALIAMIALGSLLLPATTNAADDLIVFREGAAQGQMTGGTLTAQAQKSVKYTNSETKNSVELNPWEIEFVKFGYEGLDAWGAGYSNMTSGNWAAAEQAFGRFLSDDANVKAVRCSAVQRAYLVWATHYYAGLCALRAAQANDEIGELALSDIRDEFPLNVSKTLSDKRDSEMGERELQKIKNMIKVKMRSVTKDTNGVDRGPGTDLTNALSSANRPSDVAAAVREFFVPFYKQFSAPMYQKAVDYISKPFKEPGRDENYSQLTPFWMFEMRLVSAEAYLGMSMYAEAMSELKSDADDVETPDGKLKVPARDNREDPALLYVAVDLASSSRTRGYWHYVARARFLQGRIYETAEDYRNARSIYKNLAEDLPAGPEFEQMRNEGSLNYSLNLARGVGGSFERAESNLRKQIADFEKSSGGYMDSYLMDPAEAALYAGAYLALGKIAYNEWRSTRKDTKMRQTALECYLIVTSMLSTDHLKRAEALYWASRIYREIAEEEWASKWQGQGETIVDQNGREAQNPFRYYIKMADTLRDELKANYSDTPFARMQ